MNTSNNFSQCAVPVFIWYTNPFNVSMVVLYLLVIGAAFIGNMLVCLAVVINSNLRQNVPSYFIVSLAISDIFTAVFVMPFDLEMFMTFGRWNHSEMLCIVWTTVYLSTVPTSMWNLFILSIDRYKTLKNPWDRFKESPFMTKRRALFAIAVVWICCMCLALVPEMGWKYQQTGNLIRFCQGTVCIFNATRLYLILSTIMNFYIPMIVMCFLYYKIYQIARTQYLTRPTSTLLELKSADSPAVMPKVKNQGKKFAKTGRKEVCSPLGKSGSQTDNRKEELGQTNIALEADNEQMRITRCGTMIENLDIPQENAKNENSLLVVVGHAKEGEERRNDATVDIESPKENFSTNTNTQQQQNICDGLENQNDELKENSCENSCDKDKEPKDERIEDNTKKYVTREDNNKKTLDIEISKHKDKQESPQDDDRREIVSQSPTNLPITPPVTGEEIADKDNDDNKDVAKGDGDISEENVAQDTKTCLESVEANENTDGDNDSVEASQSDEKNANQNPDNKTHELNGDVIISNHTGCKNPHQNKLSVKEKSSTDNAANEAEQNDSYHTNISPEMHVYLRRKISGEEKMKYASRESLESTCTIQSSLPHDRNSYSISCKMSASRDSINLFGSMEDLTKRKKIFVKNKKAARTISIIVGAFLICWFPSTTLSVIENICEHKCFTTFKEQKIIVMIRHVFVLFAYISSAINPFVYSYRNVQFRKSYAKMIRKMFPCIRRVVRPN